MALLGDAIKALFKGNITTGEIITALSEVLKRVPNLGELLGKIDLGDGTKLDLSGFTTEDLAEMDWNKLLTPERKAEFLKRLQSGEFDEQLRQASKEVSDAGDLNALKKKLAEKIQSNDGAALFKSAAGGDPEDRATVSDPERLRRVIQLVISVSSTKRMNDFPELALSDLQGKTTVFFPSSGGLPGQSNSAYFPDLAPGIVTRMTPGTHEDVKKFLRSDSGKKFLSRFGPLTRSEITTRLTENRLTDLYRSSALDLIFSHPAANKAYAALRTDPERFEFSLDANIQDAREKVREAGSEYIRFAENPDLILTEGIPKTTLFEIIPITSYQSQDNSKRYTNFMAAQRRYFSPENNGAFTDTMNEYRFSRYAGENGKNLSISERGLWNNRFALSTIDLEYRGPTFYAFDKYELAERIPEIRSTVTKADAYLTRIQEQPQAFAKLATKMTPEQLKGFIAYTTRMENDLVSLQFTMNLPRAGIPVTPRTRAEWLPQWVQSFDPQKVRIKIEPRGQKAQEQKPDRPETFTRPAARGQRDNQQPLLPDPLKQRLRDIQSKLPQARVHFQMPQEAVPPRIGKSTGTEGVTPTEAKEIEFTPEQYVELYTAATKALHENGARANDALSAKAENALAKLWTPDFSRWLVGKAALSDATLEQLAQVSSARDASEPRVQIGTSTLTVDIAMAALGTPSVGKVIVSAADPYALFSEIQESNLTPEKLAILRAVREQTSYESVRHWLTGKTRAQEKEEFLESATTDITLPNGHHYTIRYFRPATWPKEVQFYMFEKGIIDRRGQFLNPGPK